MKEVLYHPEVFMPDWFTAPTHIMHAKYSAHARKAANTDRYGAMGLSEHLDLSTGKVVEIGAVGKKLTKVVIRLPYDDYLDIVVVYIPDGTKGMVKTVWFNVWNDEHKTLDRSRYATR